MLKLTAILSLVLMATWSQADSKRFKKEATPSAAYDPVSTLWASGLSCDSCGSECASACGTRHFRSCCFNYLRRKRGNDNDRIWPQLRTPIERKTDQMRRPIFIIDTLAQPWLNMPEDFKTNPTEDTVENRMQILYDA